MHEVKRRREARIESSRERGAVTGPDDFEAVRVLSDEMTAWCSDCKLASLSFHCV